MESYAHVVEIEESTRTLTISRRYPNGKTESFTVVELPSKIDLARSDGFSDFARLLGENILLDSPAARRLLNL